MKIILLTLNSETKSIKNILSERYPQSEIYEIDRRQFESLNIFLRLKFLFGLRPDVFAVSTESLSWQRGKHLLLLLGSLSGASKSIIFDVRGGWIEETRNRILVRAPARLIVETISSAAIIIRTRKTLRQLEKTIEKKIEIAKPKVAFKSDQSIKMVFLRSAPGAGTQIGGAASHISGFINAVLKLGVRINFISNDEIAGLDLSKIPVKILTPEATGLTRAVFDLFNNYIFTRNAVREIKKHEIDFIYQRYGRFSWVGVVAALQTDYPLFLEFNGSEVWVGQYWDRIGMLGLLKRFEQLNLNAAALIFVVSEVDGQNLQRSGIDPKKIVINPNGVDTEKFHPQIGGAEERKSFGIADDELLVGFVGTFGPWHGTLVLAKAITLIPASENLRFLLIGGGSLRDEVEQILRDAGKIESVIFTGTVAHEKVPKLLDACDILVSPHIPLADGAEFFGSPTKLFEYMAMGKAIVASRLGQIGDILENEKTALLVEPGNVQELSEALVRLKREKNLRQKIGVAARKEVKMRYTWEHNARRVINEFSKWAAEK